MSARLKVTLLGHKDHGKSTTIGRLLVDTGSVMEDKVREVKASSEALGKTFEYAFLLDAFQEERLDGMTIDVIHAQIKGKRYVYDCIDVPGHEELIKNMLTGASHADAGILIVSAKEGIEPQTGQHLRLARWLGLAHLIVVVNKMDLTGHDEGVFREMASGVVGLFGNGEHNKISFIPISAMTGENVVARSTNMPWYTGPTLFEAMEAIERRNGLDASPLRLPVQGVYKGADGAPIIVGRVESGSIRVGQRVSVAPSGRSGAVKALIVSNTPTDLAKAGDNVGLFLDPHPDDLARGEVVCAAETALKSQTRITAPAIFLEPIPAEVVVECGTAQTHGRVEALSNTRVGEVCQVRLHLEAPLLAEPSRSSIGRMALKRQGRIIGVAVVT